MKKNSYSLVLSSLTKFKRTNTKIKYLSTGKLQTSKSLSRTFYKPISKIVDERTQ